MTKVKTMEQKSRRKGEVREVVITAQPVGSHIAFQPAHHAAYRNAITGEMESDDGIEAAKGCYRRVPTCKD